MSGGGTAGHVYPALAVADKLRADGHDVTYYGTPHGLESTLVPEAGIRFTSLEASGFDRARPWTLLTSSLGILRSATKAYRHFAADRPDVIVGFGGYVSIPVGLAARWSGIPLVLHEQNAVPGLTNRFLAKHATTVCVTYPETSQSLGVSEEHVAVTGNPVRDSVLGADRTRGLHELNITDPDAVVVLVFGGSRGARHLNAAVVSIAPQILAAANGHAHVVHATGALEFEAVVDLLSAHGTDLDRYTVVPYIDSMGDVMAATDLAVCRAGATTIAELTALGIGAILVPYPFATDDHQTKNAAAMVSSGAALTFGDADLDSPEFGSTLVRLLNDRGARDTMARASSELGRPHAADELTAQIYGAALAGRTT